MAEKENINNSQKFAIADFRWQIPLAYEDLRQKNHSQLKVSQKSLQFGRNSCEHMEIEREDDNQKRKFLALQTIRIIGSICILHVGGVDFLSFYSNLST